MSVDGEQDLVVVGCSDDPVLELPFAAATALEAEVAQLREALDSRQQIGLVTGVLAERFQLTPDEAWSLLVRFSTRSNLKVRDVARILEAGYFGELAEDDRVLAARLNDHLPLRGRLSPDQLGPAAGR